MRPSCNVVVVVALMVVLVSGERVEDLPSERRIVEEPTGWFSFKPKPDLSNTAITARWMGWMKDSLANKTLQDITIPGTHDSGAYNLTKDLLPGYTSGALEALIKLSEDLGVPIDQVITPWSLAQDRDLYGQLSAGIRYIDLRSGWDAKNGAWRTFHFELGNPVKVLLQDVKRFLDDFPTELVVIEVSHLIGNPAPTDDNKLLLVSEIEEVLGKYLYPRADGYRKIGDLVKEGKRALVTVSADHDIRNHPGLWQEETIINSYADSDNIAKMVPYNQEQAETFNKNKYPKNLYKLSWTLTPGAGAILESVIPGQPHTLEQLADVANKKLPQFGQWLQGKKYRPGNILIIDHFENSVIVDLVTKFNN